MDLERFLSAQEKNYDNALNEIENGKKKTHWMWYIFPQFKGLGRSSTSQYYAIQNRVEAEEYMKHPVLSVRLLEISSELLSLETNDATEIFGYIDDMKLQSSMTLFFLVSNNHIFKKVLDKFFDGRLDKTTIRLLNETE